MATVFMKFLERRPEGYDRGIRRLTAGRIELLRRRVAEDWVEPGDRVLDVGCGTGSQAIRCAKREALVTAIDSSPAMLEVARARSAQEGLSDRIEFLLLDGLEAGERFPSGSFDVVVLSLVLSELDDRGQRRLLKACRSLLSERGRLLVVEEVVPDRWLGRGIYRIWRGIWVAITAFLARSTTNPLRHPQQLLAEAGFRMIPVSSHPGGLSLFLGQAEEPAGSPGVSAASARGAEAATVPELRHSTSLGTILRDLYCLLTRIWPPYLRCRPGLYQVGRPGPTAPVLVTGNFDLTVRKLVREVRDLDVYLLVSDSRGINVWCAAGGGHFTADDVIAAVKRGGLEDLVAHRRLILPQLCANGVKGELIQEATGWQVKWGPTRAADIPAYLARECRKTDLMRKVDFPLIDRLEMSVAMWLFWASLLALILLVVRRGSVIPALVSSFALFLIAGGLWPQLPGYQGSTKGLFLAAASVALTVLASMTWLHLPARSLFSWCVGLCALALFVGADFQGADPRRRGGEVEQFPIIMPMELVLVALYLLVPRLAGW